ncbi:glutathione S-transferase family protein [Roseibium polysiphoniae]|uniref:Glutathione S-transferase family protein n=1 Tax=Roseibium polysiphoniae TaxID=2571221 RepID=A0ABR9C9C1_9HYPH|nr:glutathione S-transferase family protein [Roseibium polysiphoniae]MBD8875496.1 glutathione S-transferase family protein [Roseibium polysiphoniae]
MSDTLTFFHAPFTRSTVIRTLLEELDAPYELHAIDHDGGETQSAAYLDINPLGKVPAIVHRGQLITEQVALCIYLGDLFPQAGLTPGLEDPLRGPYLRWLAFAGSSFEPALVDKAMKREPAPRSMSPYGLHDDMVETLRGQLAKGPYIRGERMTVADVLWGKAVGWALQFELVPALSEFADYSARMSSRPTFTKVMELDGELQAKQKAEADTAS